MNAPRTPSSTAAPAGPGKMPPGGEPLDARGPTPVSHPDAGHAHGHGHDGDHGHDDHDDGTGHSTLKGYTIGFVLSVILTAIPFWIVMGNVFDKSSTTALVILGFAAVQIVVHIIYFLHMNTKSEGGWTMLALIFTLVLVVITLSGSLWVMFHLNHNMMPVMLHDMKNMP